MRRRKRAQSEVTIGPDFLPISHCQKCRRPGTISSCERVRLGEVYAFVCHKCQHRWNIEL